MNNKIIIQLINNNIEEIKKLINHFQNEQADLKSGFPLLESRLASLNKDIEILKLNLDNQNIDFTSNLIDTEINSDKQSKSPLEESEVHSTPKKASATEKNKSLSETNHIELGIQLIEPIKNNLDTAVSTLNDKLQASRKNNLQEKIQKSKLLDIQSAIGINDQFLFIRELFDNNTEDYKAAINYINNQSDCNKIISHFNKTKQWDNQKDTVIQFFDLIKRKFE
ncbi:hypothetical protein [Ancylomarina euxinus]|nr:hypothetical protein [Ancylomarina euxinus]MCZ4694429.1 hypothetical protein [Ancylomarina euxinus]MUP16671.1 hypothetical protein [Ancylomarina euxinus]